MKKNMLGLSVSDGFSRLRIYVGKDKLDIMKRVAGLLVAAALVPVVSIGAEAEARSELRGARLLRPLPAGAVRPQGWLEKECRAAANGYVGRLDEVFPKDVSERFREAWSPAHPKRGKELHWIGGRGISFEIGGYWFDGLVRLACALDDPALLAKAQGKLDGVVTNMSDDAYGFLWWQKRSEGPFKDVFKECSGIGGCPTWVLGSGYGGFARALSTWQAARPSPIYRRALKSAYDFDDLLLEGGWCGIAPQAAVLAWEATHDAAIASRLDAFFARVGAGSRCHTILEPPPEDCKEPRKRKAPGHGVTRVESLVGTVFGYFWTGERRYLENAKAWVRYLDGLALLPNGAWAADEYFRPVGAWEGTEACTVTAAEWLYLNLLSAEGDGRWGDSIERLFFNAGMRVTDRSYLRHVVFVRPNTLDDHDYRLQASVGCCSANLTRILPLFVQHLWMATPDGGLAAALYAPSSVTATVAGGVAARIDCDTAYPCSDTVRLSLTLSSPTEFPLLLRLPGWCEKPALAVNGKAVAVECANGFARLRRTWKTGDVVTLNFPFTPHVRTMDIRTDPSRHYGEFWWDGCEYNTQEWLGDQSDACARQGAFVEAGPLCFALLVKAAEWQYCLDARTAEPQVDFLPTGDWPVRVRVNGRAADWPHDPKLPGLPHPSFVRLRETKPIELVPYGSALSAISVFPTANFGKIR